MHEDIVAAYKALRQLENERRLTYEKMEIAADAKLVGEIDAVLWKELDRAQWARIDGLNDEIKEQHETYMKLYDRYRGQ